ncbi:hypothetical protein ACFPRA_01360 [Sporosarcina soli]|uniref:Uncharacterized protein n=1 Tax=Sporosarcina soli TaxID=334736 RepID=A0ABW0TGL5_9BACL
MNLIKYMQYIIETDKTIRELLHFEVDEMTGIKYPSVAYGEIPEGMQMPYLRIYEESNTPNEDHETRRLIRFEVIAENDYEIPKRAITRLEQIFARRNLLPFAVGSFLMGRVPKPTESGFYGEILTLMVRQHRQDLIDLKEALPDVYVYFKVKKG